MLRGRYNEFSIDFFHFCDNMWAFSDFYKENKHILALVIEAGIIQMGIYSR